MSLKDKLAKMKTKAAPKAAPAAKKAAKAPAAKAKAAAPEKRKKAIGFEMPKTHSTKMTKNYEKIATLNDQFAESLNTFLEGKKTASTESRAILQEMIVTCKELRNNITEAKAALKPIYS
jgi:hypothetical protein